MRDRVDQQRLEELLKLLNIERKRDAEKYCRTLTIRSDEFADIILAARLTGMRPYIYDCRFTEYTPKHLNPSGKELEALAKNGVGKMGRGAQKAANKIFQIFEDRRMFSAHLFYTPSHNYWHLFYFDQRDVTDHRNHWRHGPHIHYSRESFTNKPLKDVWAGVCSDPPELPKAIHIRYDYHHNRRKNEK